MQRNITCQSPDIQYTYNFADSNSKTKSLEIVWLKNIYIHHTSGSERLLDIVCPPTLYAIWNEAKYNVQFSGVIQNIENRCAIRAKFWKNWFLLYKIGYFGNNRHRQVGVKMAQRFSIFWITPLNCTLYLASFHMAYSVGGQTLSRSLSDPDVFY